MVFLHSNGVGTARAVRIFKTYGVDAVQVMTENPYRLARDIRGIGFKTADAIAMKLGIEKTAMIRLRAGISYALTEAMDEGHCGLPTDQLIPLAEKLLEAPKDLILTALELERSDGAVIADKVGDAACMFLAGLYRAEQAIADRLIRIARGRLPWPWIDEAKAIPWVEKRSGLQLADSQKAAIRQALIAKALVITGGPGVGKTTIVNSILKILAAKGVRLLLCAPTGRAAKRMTEATGVEAKTIHRLLEVDPRNGGFKRNADNPLDCDLLVIDEASMIDVMLMQALMKATPDDAALLIVGDIDQLPSVGPGQVLADIIGSGAAPVVRLTEVFRQAAASRIIINAHRINQGLMPDLSAPAGNSDFYFVPAEDPETVTMHADLSFVSAAFEAGVSGYVLKQSAATELVTALHEVENGRRYISLLIQKRLGTGAPGFLRRSKKLTADLTSRQREVLQLVAEGRVRKEIAQILGVSVKTVEFHKQKITEKLGIHTDAALTAYAIRHGIASAE